MEDAGNSRERISQTRLKMLKGGETRRRRRRTCCRCRLQAAREWLGAAEVGVPSPSWGNASHLHCLEDEDQRHVRTTIAKDHIARCGGGGGGPKLQVQAPHHGRTAHAVA